MLSMASSVLSNNASPYAGASVSLGQATRQKNKKKVMFYPEVSTMKNKDKQLYDFLCQDFGDPFDGKEIEPDNMMF